MDKILAGRKLVEDYRTAHNALYTQKEAVSFATKPTAEKLAICTKVIDDHRPLIEKLHKDLVALGFKSQEDFFEQSEQADIDENIPEKERWA